MREGNPVFERAIVDQVLGRLVKQGHVQVTFWDGSVGEYGDPTSSESLAVEIVDPALVRRLLVNASLAVGEGYMNGQLLVDEEQLPLLFELIIRNQPATSLRQPFRRQRNEKDRQKSYIETHYDVGNNYYDMFLDPSRLYSCAYFVNEADSLEKAQRQKIDHLLDKLLLEPGMRLLDIGCGWGRLSVAAAKRGVQVLGITLSSEQLKGAKELAIREGVADRIEFRLANYQDLKEEKFDRVISVGMFEHVGRDNGDQYFSKIVELLVPGGVSVLHTITQQQPRPTNSWIDRYVFPGGYLPTVAEIEVGLATHELWSIDRENLWWHYAETLRHWRIAHRAHRDQIIRMFDEHFYRLRDFWLAGSEANFRYGQLGLTQVIFTKGKPADGTWPTTRRYQYR